MKIYTLIIEYDDKREEIEFVSEELYDRDYDYIDPEVDEEAITTSYYIELDAMEWDKEDIKKIKQLGILGDA